MQTNQKPKLSLLPRERRASRREPLSDSRTALLHIEGGDPVPVTLSMVDIGTFGLSTSADLSSISGTVDLQIEMDGDILINGFWTLAGSRADGGGKLFVFEHPQIQVVRASGGSATPETFLRKSRYRIFDLSDSHHANDVGTHFTELKDFSVSVGVVIYTTRSSFKGSFDFSSERKSLELIDFSVESQASNFPAGEKVRLEYTYLGVRYSFSSEVDAYDTDFKILSVKCFSHLIAITARRFDRHSCDFVAMMQVGGISVAGRLTQLSPTGGQFRASEMESAVSVGSDVSLNVTDIPELLSGNITHLSNGIWGLKFESDDLTRKGLHRLFAAVLPKSIVTRDQSNYSSFMELFGKVGYTPQDADNLPQWTEETIRSWTYQDNLLPGTCTGGMDGSGSVISSTGTLPFAEQIAYGHSFCMVKTAEGAATFFEQALHSLAISELIPNVRYYAGSYAKQSRFTTRLHVIFETHSPPDRQAIVHSEQLFPSSNTAVQAVNEPKIKIEKVENLENYLVNAPLKDVIKLLSKPHQLFHEVHQITSYVVTLNGDSAPCAVILKNDGWRSFTAAGMFGFSWVFSIREKLDLGSLCIDLRGGTIFAAFPLQVIEYDGSVPNFGEVGDDYKKPAFWTITDKDDFGPVIASMARAVYAILRKYGETGLVEQLKIA